MKNSVRAIRTSFLDYFAKNNHKILPSAPLIPHNDPTLMFVNAGMVQFKNIFTGLEKAPAPSVVTSQKCVRAGGKHNDLENVGYTARHHTFFEMLGNFSFGDYFKEDAIRFAWGFINGELGLPAEKLVVTIYHTDDEAFDLWKKIANLPDERIIRIDTNDNFWSMGDVGPCGPCSEIFYDHGEEIEGNLPGSGDEGDRYIEIWNLVFMQYEKLENGKRIDLPKPAIDTGMGLERIAAVMQGVHNNYDIDLFKNLIAAIKKISKTKGDEVSYRVIADHLRSSAFLIADGVLPSNEGRGYILRRIMRRAMRHAHQLGCREPLMHLLVPALIVEMGDDYIELKKAQKLIVETLKDEEERFKVTLEKGLKILEEEAVDLKSGDKLGGSVAFKLYDTYGFPLDLTQDILRPRNISVDEAEFEREMEIQKERGRSNWSGSGESADSNIWFALKNKIGATAFKGYENSTLVAIVKSLIIAGEEVSDVKEGKEVAIVTDQTCFYAESGGQVGDRGTITNGNNIIEISDTKKLAGDLFVHFGTVKKGSFKIGDKVTLEIDERRQRRIKANHSATHLLHKALREVLGDHVTQKGSLVSADVLRFDFSQNKPLSLDDLVQVEDMVNFYIRQNQAVQILETDIDEANKLGAMALFGEKYGDKVRVLSMGVDEGSNNNFSVELCGGTHVERTGDIGLFKIISEGSVASGVRRIEALTARKAFEYLREQEGVVAHLAENMKSAKQDVLRNVENLIIERKNLEKELGKLKRASATATLSQIKAEEINNIKFIAQKLDGVDGKDLRDIANNLLKQHGGLVGLAAVNDGKVAMVVALEDVLKEKYSAVELLKAVIENIGGKGCGGNQKFAQGGGNNPHGVEEAFSLLKKQL
jgi:alanyl-tRNA synthetase